MRNQRSNFKRKQLHYSPNLLSTINNALENKRILHIEYEGREQEETNRDTEPMALIYKSRKRHLVAWCRLRDDYRCFRLDRMNGVKVMLEEFEPREGFKEEDFLDEEDIENNNNYHSSSDYDDYDDDDDSEDDDYEMEDSSSSSHSSTDDHIDGLAAKGL